VERRHTPPNPRRYGKTAEEGDGEPIRGLSLDRRFVTAAKRAKLPGLPFHDLRHLFGTQASRAFNISTRYSGSWAIGTSRRRSNTCVTSPTPDAAAKLSGLWGGQEVVAGLT
jgi:integrase